MADKGKDPLPIFKKSISLTKKIKILKFFGLVQERLTIILQAKQLNCNIITMPPKVINQINGLEKVLNH